ncbi:head-tail adaptor protein [Algicella marina]|uniref:Head-tail adaptor protein n=1 Tax=Algicella marina TaxID=2683284 RepID=A0A6P1SYE4_9RHOB|nr:head-tail adaptor protein [Algicella marina]QHQ34555.1 head-tail adaptor protein [Algicella marina]
MTVPNLNRALVLETRQNLADGAGGVDPAWMALGTLWADVSARTGTESVIGGRQTPRQRFRIVVRAAPFGAPSRPRPDQRFRDGDRIFNINAVTEFDPPGHYLICDCEEGGVS